MHEVDEQPLLRRMLATAREDERRRCARELHDETLQALGALRMQLAAARSSDDMATLRAAVDGAVHSLEREIAALRTLITELRPAALDLLGLRPALEALFERTASLYDLRLHTVISIDEGEPERLDPEVETAVFRIIQEALTNVGRHAGATHVHVSVRKSRGEITLAVIDDGAGFDAERTGGGFGLLGMHERVALAGGRLEVRSNPDGTSVLATLPAPHGAPALGAATLSLS